MIQMMSTLAEIVVILFTMMMSLVNIIIIWAESLLRNFIQLISHRLRTSINSVMILIVLIIMMY